MLYLEPTKKLIEEKNISDNLTQKLFQSLDGDNLIVEFIYNKKFIIERSFQNTFDGKQELKNTIEQFNSDEKIRSYFRL